MEWGAKSEPAIQPPELPVSQQLTAEPSLLHQSSRRGLKRKTSLTTRSHSIRSKSRPTCKLSRAATGTMASKFQAMNRSYIHRGGIRCIYVFGIGFTQVQIIIYTRRSIIPHCHSFQQLIAEHFYVHSRREMLFSKITGGFILYRYFDSANSILSFNSSSRLLSQLRHYYSFPKNNNSNRKSMQLIPMIRFPYPART